MTAPTAPPRGAPAARPAHGRPTHGAARLPGGSAAALLALLALAALAAPWLAPWDPARQFDLVALQNRPPSWAHPLGTDVYARDLLSRLLHAARTTLGVGVVAAAVATGCGALWGLATAALDGAPGRALLGLVDAARGVPRVLLLLAVVALWGAVPPLGVALLLGVTGWFGIARLVHAQVQALLGRDFAHAAAALGATRRRILARHVAPHLWPTLLVAGTLGLGDAIALEAALSFLGLGVRPPAASWGSMVQDGSGQLATAWWTVAAPAACIVATVLAAAVLGDRLADRLAVSHPGDDRAGDRGP